MKHCIPTISTVKGEGIIYKLSSASIGRDRLFPIQCPTKISTSTETPNPNPPTDDIEIIEEGPGPVRNHGQVQGHVHGENKLNICSLCRKFFSTSSSLKVHITRWCKQKIQKQKILSKQTQRRSSRIAKARFPCETLCDSYQDCGTTITATRTNKKFKSQQSIKIQHQNNGSICSLFVCRFCTQCFTSTENRSIHENEQHMATVEPYKCKSCERRFIFAEDCSFHESLHSETWAKLELGISGSEKIQNQCVNNTAKASGNLATATGENSTLVSQSNLILIPDATKKIMKVKKNKTHVNSTTPFVCSTCYKGFATSRSRDIHNQIHMGHFPYICKYCGWKYVTIGKLNFHSKMSACARKNRMLISENNDEAETNADNSRRKQVANTTDAIEGPRNRFPCSVCGERLKTKYNLIQHSLGHSKPFKCQYCPKLTSRKNLMLIHEKIHTGETTTIYHFCQVCNRPFHFLNHLGTHLKDVHSQ